MSDSFSSDFILLTDKLKEEKKISFAMMARLIGLSETRMKNIRRKNSTAGFEDLNKLISHFPELKQLDFHNKEQFTSDDTADNDQEEYDDEDIAAKQQRIVELEKENDRLMAEIKAKMETIDFQAESNRLLSRTVDRLLGLLEKNERGELTEEDLIQIDKEIEEYKRSKEEE